MNYQYLLFDIADKVAIAMFIGSKDHHQHIDAWQATLAAAT